MSHHNTSDLIEAYLKKILEDSETIEIRRAEMANFVQLRALTNKLRDQYPLYRSKRLCG